MKISLVRWVFVCDFFCPWFLQLPCVLQLYKRRSFSFGVKNRWNFIYGNKLKFYTIIIFPFPGKDCVILYMDGNSIFRCTFSFCCFLFLLYSFILFSHKGKSNNCFENLNVNFLFENEPWFIGKFSSSLMEVMDSNMRVKVACI